jgi:hypothetical protein
MNDASNKEHRRQLLKNLTGDAAFATAESKARWQAKHMGKAVATAAETEPTGETPASEAQETSA